MKDTISITLKEVTQVWIPSEMIRQPSITTDLLRTTPPKNPKLWIPKRIISYLAPNRNINQKMLLKRGPCSKKKRITRDK